MYTTRRNAADSLKCGRHRRGTLTRHPRPGQDHHRPGPRSPPGGAPPRAGRSAKAQRGAASGARGAGVLVGLDGCEVLLCDPCARVRPCPGSPGVFLPVPVLCTSVPVLYDVKRISFCPTRYWLTVAVASSHEGALEYKASLVRTEYEAAASALDARTAAWFYSRTGTDCSRYPRLVPSSSRLGLRQHRLRGIQGGRRPPCSGCVVVSPASVLYSGARLAPAPCSTRGPS